MSGISLIELKRDLRLINPDIRPTQLKLDKYIDKNSKSYNPKFYRLIKGFLPIDEFSIEPNKNIRNNFSLEYKRYNEINYLLRENHNIGLNIDKAERKSRVKT